MGIGRLIPQKKLGIGVILKTILSEWTHDPCWYYFGSATYEINIYWTSIERDDMWLILFFPLIFVYKFLISIYHADFVLWMSYKKIVLFQPACDRVRSGCYWLCWTQSCYWQVLTKQIMGEILSLADLETQNDTICEACTFWIKRKRCSALPGM